MRITTNQAEKAMTGGHVFSQLGLSMLLQRLKRMYSDKPTPETLQKCTEEINIFLEKYKKIMTADYAILSSL
ncbi:MAG: hypothetical protein FWC89_08710 [Defluviitaleaceae bacterium]|nr:hypothetical protein [Defluviitaleaceae bacterium]